MKFLLAATPLSGHVNPILSIGRILIAQGHSVVFTTGTTMREKVEQIGASFVPFPSGADLDLRDMDAAFPKRRKYSGVDLLRFSFGSVFFDPMLHQYAGFREILKTFDAQVLITDNYCFGTLPMLIGPRDERPAIIHCGVSYLQCTREDGAPYHAGYPPAQSPAERKAYLKLRDEAQVSLLDPLHDHLDMRLAELGFPPLSMNFFDAAAALPDLYLHTSVPGFEYPRYETPKSVHFIGALPSPSGVGSLPSWSSDLDGSRRVVLVTQGTVSNRDLGQLIEPTLAAMADEPDVLVVVTTGGQSLKKLSGPIPANVRVEEYLPFDWLLPKVDVLVTNGGYGTVNQALACGVPLVVAGTTEDKAEVCARVAWSGTGINLKTSTPSVDALKSAIREVLDVPRYRDNAERLEKEFAGVDAGKELLRLINELAVESTGEPEPTRRVIGGGRADPWSVIHSIPFYRTSDNDCGR
jgi:UDP:flavonoid glycosyltransferase YjiC (YdhE family)